MLRSYVCRQCALRLSRRTRRVGNPQWQPQATFTTFRSNNAQVGTEPPQAEPPPPQYGGRYSQYLAEDAGTLPQLSTSNSDHAQYTQDTAPSSEEAQGFAQPMENALRRRNLYEAWKLFQISYPSRQCEALTNPPPCDLPLLDHSRIFTNLLVSVNKAFCHPELVLPVTPTTVLIKFEELGVARPEHWVRHTLAYLTTQVIQAVNSPTDTSPRDLPSILSELLSVWRLFFKLMTLDSDSPKSTQTGWHLPPLESLPEMFEGKDFIRRLQTYHPKFNGSPTLGFCAVYMYTIADALNAMESLQQQAAPFLQFLERLIAGSRVDSVLLFPELMKGFSDLPGDVQEQIQLEVFEAPSRALGMISQTGENLEPERVGDAANNRKLIFFKRIERLAKSRKSAAGLARLWDEARTIFIEGDKVAVPSQIYNALLSGFMEVRQPQHSVEVWNHMITHGVCPDVASWVALLNGCSKSKDLDGLNAIWKRMLNAGVEPDNHAWTTRVNGLIALRQVNLGLAALDDMGKRWLSAETAIKQSQTPSKTPRSLKNLPKSPKAVNNHTKPSVDVINGAISALMQMREGNMRYQLRIEHVNKILGWARHFGIEPNVRTFNILVQLYLNAKKPASAFKVLRQMEKDGIQVDVATYTILITALFDNNVLNGLSEAEQIDRILRLFHEFEATGIILNNYIYAAAIDKFLKQYSNFTAARSLIEHMTARKLVPDAYVFTSILTHYFQQDPPAIEAVDGLVDYVLTNHRTTVDRMLFDRVLQGYALHGEVERMVALLTRLKKQQRTPSWKALSIVVKALAEAGDMESARALVRDVHHGEGIAGDTIEGDRKDRALFDFLVRAIGIDLREDISSNESRQNETSETANVQGESSQQHVHEEGMDQLAHNEEDELTLSPGAYPSQYLDHGREIRSLEGAQQTREYADQGTGKTEEDVHGFLSNDPGPEPEHQQSQKL